jgi:hypothetical protein
MTHVLDELFSPRQLRRDADTLATWGCDWTRSFPVDPSAVVFPESVDDVVRLVREANAHGMALVPSGGRTGLSGGAVAGNGEIVVSFDRMNAVLDFEPADRLVRCQAGVVTQALQDVRPRAGPVLPGGFRLCRLQPDRRQHRHQRRRHQGDPLRAHPRLDRRPDRGHRPRRGACSSTAVW